MMEANAVLVAISDCLVLTALERAWSRTVPRSQRSGVPGGARHSGYERVSIHHDKIDRALLGAWDLCPLLTNRHRLDVDPVEWADLLDSYTRALIMMQQPHRPHWLAQHLAPLVHAFTNDDDEIELDQHTASRFLEVR